MVILINVIGGLGLFLFGMTVMSEGLQKVAGKRLRMAIRKLTSNRFAGIFTGFAVTGIIQSSSATTVMLVSFVNAGLMTLQQSIGVIMGANIGTTVTGWLVALIGFKMKISIIALVAVGIGFFMRLLGKKSLPYIGEILLGFGLIFIGLDFMKDATVGLKDATVITDWMCHFSANSYPMLLMAILMGAVVTMVIQSSSATLALTMTMGAQGLLDFPTAAALILGQNIGTTITANLAAIGASRNAKRCALAHMFFNVVGAMVMSIFLGLFVGLTERLVPGDPTSAMIITGRMAAFHTIFNCLNTILFLPFVNSLAKLAETIIPKRTKEVQVLTYIDQGLFSTPGLDLESARMELSKMLKNVLIMIEDVMEILKSPGMEAGLKADEIDKIEQSTDDQKKRITIFLRGVMRHSSSEHDGIEVTRILGNIKDLERIGDHCKGILKLTNRVFSEGINLTIEAHEDLLEIARESKNFLSLIENGFHRAGDNIMEEAAEIEKRIDALRNAGQEHHRIRLLKNSCDDFLGLVFLDLLSHFEKIGDHSYNIAQRVSGVR